MARDKVYLKTTTMQIQTETEVNGLTANTKDYYHTHTNMQSEFYNKLLVLQCSVYIYLHALCQTCQSQPLLTVVFCESATETVGKPCSWNPPVKTAQI